MKIKVCKTCKKEFNQRPDRRGSVCKECLKTINKQKADIRAASRNIDYAVYKKICTMCNVEKSGTEFTIRKMSKDGLDPKCKICKAIGGHEYYENNTENIINNVKAYSSREENKIRSRELGRIRQKHKMETDPQYRLMRRNRNRIRVFTRERGIVKPNSTIAALGCTWTEFKTYIEKQFADGMNWENDGTLWHIDHIIPLNRFDLSNLDDFRRANHYTNLRPLLASKNLARRDQINFIESLPEIQDFLVSQGFSKINDFEYTKNDITIHYSSINKNSEPVVGKDYHKDLLNKNKRVFIIFSDEWLSRKSAVMGYVKSLIGNVTRIGARKCQVKKIQSVDYRDFLEKYHIQGYNGHIGYGLYYNNELVSVMTFKDLFNGVYDLNRYCNKEGLSITGGFQRLLNQFCIDYKPINIVSFSDNRLSQGGVYIRNGFKFEHKTEISYYYFKIGNDAVKHHKMGFRKEKLVSKFSDPEKVKNLTEYEMAKSLGYERVWDCGNTKWMLTI